MKEKDNRPVYLNPFVHLPIIGISSILHRISGLALFFIFIIVVWMLDRSLSSEEEFLNLLNDLNNLLLLKVIFYLFLVGILYHSLIGLKKLISDFFGIGEDLRSGSLISWVYIFISVLASICLFFKLFI